MPHPAVQTQAEQGSSRDLSPATSGASLPAHTPGPWLLEDDDWGHRICMGDAITSPYDHETHNLIKYEHGCDPVETPEQFTQALANARLIAAAPDLLEALQAIAIQPDETSEHAGHLAFHQVRDLARAAIAKATGGAS